MMPSAGPLHASVLFYFVMISLLLSLSHIVLQTITMVVFLTAKVVSLLGALAMAGVILWAAIAGDFSEEGAQIVALPWGVVSLVDLYSGFALIIVWFFFREDSWVFALIWSVLLLVMGNLCFCVYVFVQLFRSERDLKWFFMGNNGVMARN
jgi:hypothetical protein